MFTTREWADREAVKVEPDRTYFLHRKSADPTEPGRRVVAYVRSTCVEDILMQLRLLRLHHITSKLESERVYCDHEAGYTMALPGMRALMREAEAHKVEAIVLADIACIGSPPVARQFWADCSRFGIPIVDIGRHPQVEAFRRMESQILQGTARDRIGGIMEIWPHVTEERGPIRA